MKYLMSVIAEVYPSAGTFLSAAHDLVQKISQRVENFITNCELTAGNRL